MSTNVTLNGVTYAIPAEGDSGWGTVLSNYFIAISNSVLQKTGGTFTLTGEVDFGATYGLKSAYLKSQATNPSGVGVIRLGNTETVSWRNAANSANLSLTVSASNALQFDGTSLPLSGAIVNADIAAGAAIAYSKLAALTASRLLVSDGSGVVSVSAVTATEAGYLSGVTSAIQTQIDSKQATGSYITALTGDVTASGPGSSAATISGLAYSKLAALTADRALVSSGAGVVSVATTTAAEIGYVNGVTSAIQTQLDAKTLKATLTTKGDIYVATGASTVVRKAVGADGTVLTAASGQADGLDWTAPLTNPMTTGGDIIYGGASGAATRLANGSAGQLLTSAGGTSAPTWGVIITAWTSFTPTGSWNTNVTYSGMQRRVGDTLQCRVVILVSGGAPNSVSLTVNLPSGLTIDTTKLINPTVAFANMGGGAALDASTAVYPLAVQYSSTSAVGVYAANAASTYTNLVGASQAIPFAFNTGDAVEINYVVPISGW